MAILKGFNIESLNFDTFSFVGTNISGTWLHGKSFINVNGSPIIITISPYGGPASTGFAHLNNGFPFFRLTITKEI